MPMHKITRHIPNLVTMLNLLSGSMAIILAFSGELVLASWMIILAAFFDFMDGLLARLLGAGSEIGAQLDSLADVVSFGLAPAVIIYLMMMESPGLPLIAAGNMPLVPLFSLLIVAAAAYRLARFNSDSGEKYHFRGLPTPSTGLFVASLPLTLNRYQEMTGLTDFIADYRTLVGIVIFLSLLMVSRIPMISLKIKSFHLKEQWPVFTLLAAAPLLILFFQCLGIPLIIFLYVILSLVDPAK